mgnify:CR=1 FL=1
MGRAKDRVTMIGARMLVSTLFSGIQKCKRRKAKQEKRKREKEERAALGATISIRTS